MPTNKITLFHFMLGTPTRFFFVFPYVYYCFLQFQKMFFFHGSPRDRLLRFGIQLEETNFRDFIVILDDQLVLTSRFVS